MTAQTLRVVDESESIPGLTLDDALELFLDDRMARNLSPCTVTWYRNRLRPILAWLQAHGITTVPEVRTADLQAYIEHRRREGQLQRVGDRAGTPYKPRRPLSPKVLKDYRVATRAWWNYLLEQDLAEENPALRLPKVRQIQKVIEAFSEDDQRRLLDKPDKKTFAGSRNHAALVLMLGTGIRLSEMLNLQVGDVQLPAHKFKVMGKGAKERELPLSARVESTLRKYLKLREQRMRELAERNGATSDYVFPTEVGTRMHPRSFAKVMWEYGHQVDIRVRCSPHTCRHTFALNFVRAGGQPFQLQVLLGHSDLTMTRRYCNLASVDAFEQGRAFNPIETLGLGDAPAVRVRRKLR